MGRPCCDRNVDRKPCDCPKERKDMLWRTGEGKDVLISDMSDRHLTNAIAYLARAGAVPTEREPEGFQAPTCSDEIGDYGATGHLAAADEADWKGHALYLMLQEQRRRQGARSPECRAGCLSKLEVRLQQETARLTAILSESVEDGLDGLKSGFEKASRAADADRVRWGLRAAILTLGGDADAVEARDRTASLPDDIRAAGWAVAVHNDFRMGGQAHTFWLFTKGGRCVKGEGLTDAEALNVVRDQIRKGA